MKTVGRNLALIGLTCLSAVSLQAANYYAARSGQAPSSPYTSWATAASNIQDAVNRSANGDTVWVGPGMYTLPPNPTNYEATLNVAYINKNIHLRSSNGVPQSTIINGEGKHRAIAYNYNQSAKPFILDGFTISNCWATNRGGGIVLYSGATTLMTSIVQNCIISDNRLAWKTMGYGGGFFAQHSYSYDLYQVRVSKCVVRRNEALYGPAAGNIGFGGGVGSLLSVLMMTDCTVEDNLATKGGGLYGGAATIEKSIIRRNHAKVGTAPGASIYEPNGGGLLITTATLRNCLLEGNRTDQGTQQAGFSGTMESCTVAGGVGGNSAYGGPVNAANLVCVNSVIVSNSLGVALASRNSIRTTGHVYATNCFLEPFPGRDQVLANYTVTDSITGNNIDPKFVSYTGKDFHLAPSSPCVHEGLNQTWMTGARDLDGNPRVDRAYNLVDMGCYEIPVVNGTAILIR